jgi:hypothetical protein
MGAKHVFVETNWVVDCFAPAHFATPAARELLALANDGSLSVHVPNISLSEARGTIRRKFQPRNQTDPLRNYLRWAKESHRIESQVEAMVRRELEAYERTVLAQIELVDGAVGDLRKQKGVDVFALTEEMLEFSLSLGTEKLELGPFDQAILSAVLAKTKEIKLHEPDAEIFFCELDSDLQPWDKNGNIRQPLARLYDEARVWVYGDFQMTSPPRPDDWPR